MEATDFINVLFRDLHSGLKGEVEPLTQDQLLAVPAEGVNTIAFLLWHYTRSEDQVLIGQAAGRDPIWKSGGWAQRLGALEGVGTGFSQEQMLAFRPEKADLLGYASEVWEAVPKAVAALSPADLDRAPNPDRPSMTLGRSIANFAVGHGFWHLGDIRFTKGLMGMPFAR